MTNIDTDPRALECEERASMAVDEMRAFLKPRILQYGWKNRILHSQFNKNERLAYAQVELVGLDVLQAQLEEVQPLLNEIVQSYSGKLLLNNINHGPMNQDTKDAELYGLPVAADEVSLYAAFGFANDNGSIPLQNFKEG